MKKLIFSFMIFCLIFLASCGKNLIGEKKRISVKSRTLKSQTIKSKGKKEQLKYSDQLKSDCQYACISSGNTRTREGIRIMNGCLLSCDESARTRKKEIERNKFTY